VVVEKLGLGLLKNRQGQGRGPGVEVVDALFGHSILHCGWHSPAAREVAPWGQLRQGVGSGHGGKAEVKVAVLSKNSLLVNGDLPLHGSRSSLPGASFDAGQR
jgi:hypothetical protein